MNRDREWRDPKRRRLEDPHIAQSIPANQETLYYHQHTILEPAFLYPNQTLSNSSPLGSSGYSLPANSVNVHSQTGRACDAVFPNGESVADPFLSERAHNFKNAFTDPGMNLGPVSSVWIPEASQLPGALLGCVSQRPRQTIYYHDQIMIPPQEGPPDPNFLVPTFDRTSTTGYIEDTSITPTPQYQLHDIQATEQDHSSEVVCFGMIPRIASTCRLSKQKTILTDSAVKIVSSDAFVSCGTDSIIQGCIPTEHGQMIQSLLEETDLELCAFCSIDGGPSAASTEVDRVFTQRPCSLEITIFGPFDLFEEIGSWFQEYSVYLQDPVNPVGRQDVKYCNPHRLSTDDFDSCVSVSEIISSGSGLGGFEDMSDQPDFLEVLSTCIELFESPQPAAVRTALERHQKQALTFMVKRERGWAFEEDGDLWSVRATHRGTQFSFFNNVTEAIQLKEPPPLRGGIIADPMGLGKTLTMIALTATDLEPELYSSTWHPNQSLNTKTWIDATLIIVPPPLLSTWQEQISDHTLENAMKIRLHYGKEKLDASVGLKNTHIVLTTYHTVSAEWKSRKGQERSVLFSSHWKRIILDEAHFIRNEHSQMSRAVCELDSTARWAVTGTPIQNRLDDLSTLLKFIRAYPYESPKRFKTDISNLLKSGEEQKAIARLKYISASLLLRRPKTTISLPPRKDMKLVVDFTTEEREAYNNIRSQVISRIDEALHPGTDTASGIAYVNVLQRIESLRLICNLGLHYNSRHGESSQRPQDDWDSMAQSTFNTRREMESIHCLQCSSNIGLLESLLDLTDDSRGNFFFRCLRFCCGDCTLKIRRPGKEVVCGHSPTCPRALISFVGQATEEVATPNTAAPRSGLSLPSKIRAVITDIKGLPNDTKCVVFSTWRLTLDLVEAGLRKELIGHVRFDGKVPLKDRQSVIDKFKTDPDTRIMLLTMTCGAVGLTLTVASRAYLMEPHWNPTLEEQALARIHRIGQTREVTTIRLSIRDSFEEQVVKLQADKKQLAGLLLSPHDGEETNDRLGGLHNLKALL